MAPENFRFFQKALKNSSYDGLWSKMPLGSLQKPAKSLPRASQEPSQSPQEALHSLQEPPIRPPRGFQEPALQTFLHSCHAPQSYCCIHSRRRGMYWLAVLQWLKYASIAHDHCSIRGSDKLSSFLLCKSFCHREHRLAIEQSAIYRNNYTCYSMCLMKLHVAKL